MTERDDRELESLMRDVQGDFDRDPGCGGYLQPDEPLAVAWTIEARPPMTVRRSRAVRADVASHAVP